MSKKIASVLLAASLLGAAGCHKAEAAPPAATAGVTEAEANAIADRSVTAWTSQDAAKIKALYAPDPAGFDSTAPALITDRATWDRNLDAYAAAKVDRARSKGRKVQLLAPDVFAVSESWDLSSTAIPANAFALRCTQVYRRKPGGDWLIVTEHCSNEPKGA